MKKLLLLTVAAIMAAGTLYAENKPADEVRIYINPGHGSWGPNDRPMATIPYPNLPSTGMPDTCGFYESNTNLWKCLKLYDVLQNMGVKKENLMMSRVKNGPYPYTTSNYDPEEEFNRPLSEIACEVDANNMDMFISIHSNAHEDGYTTNYPAIFYSGYDQGKSASDYDFFNNSVGELPDFTGPRLPESYDMAQAMWVPHYMDEIDPNSYYSRTNPCIRGDISFWSGKYYNTVTSKGNKNYGYYGVLRQSTPGFLIEGYFHTYQPARHRALNMDYCHQEGVRTARGICNYFGLNPERIGYIMGTVKDVHEKIVNNLYNYSPGSIDQWMPLNGARVDLIKGEEVVKTYQVDQNYNGVFVFEDLEPGNYKLRASLDGFKEQGTFTEGTITSDCLQDIEASLGEFVVKANETTYARLYLEAEGYEPPEVNYENYPDPVQPAYVTLADEYVFEKESQEYPVEGDIRRAIVRGDSIVVLTENNGDPAIYLINAKTKQLIKQISVNGIAPSEPNNVGFRHRLSDIAFTADNKLVGVNNTLCQINADYVFDGEQRGTLRFYKWDDLDSDPVEWTTTQLSANWYRAYMGRTLAVSGPSTECTLVTTGTTAYTSTCTRLFLVSMSNDQQVGTLFTEYNLNSEKQLSENKTGVDQQLMVSPLGDDRWVMDGEKCPPYELKPATQSNIDATIMGMVDENLLNKEANGVGFFKYAGRSLMVSPYSEGTTVAGVKLFDVTDGLGQAKLIKTIGTDLEQASPAPRMADADALPYMAAGAKVDGSDITLYLMAGNTVTRFSTVGVQQPAVKGIFAYGLNCTKGEEQYTFDFNANSDAESAKIIFTDKETGEVLGEVEVPNVKEGANSVTLTFDELPGETGQEMNWAVNLVGKNIPSIALLNNMDDFDYKYTFNTVDNSPESDYFGRIYIGHRPDNGDAKNGLWIYNPDWTKHNESVIKTRTDGLAFRSNYRLGIDCEGKVYMPDWGDPTSGVFVFDPANEEGGLYPFFAHADGTPLNRDGDGMLTNDDGVAVGGSSPGVFVYGSGADSKLYVYNEDIKVNGTGNNVSVYNIGNEDGTLAKYWDQAPDFTDHIGPLQANTNGNVWAMSNGGYWVAQYRSAGNNNGGVPSLIFVNAEGEVVFNSGKDAETASVLNGSNGAGFAVSKDEKTLVINDGSTDFQFFDIEWNDGVPTLKHKYAFTGIASGNSRSGLVYQMNFDYAGNLIVSGAKVGIYSIPTEDNQTTVPAKKALIVVKGTPEEPKYYVTGTFNGWDKVNPTEMIDNEVTLDMEDNAEFKLLTPNPSAEDGWTWIGGVDENQVGFFLITEEMMAEGRAIDVLMGAGSNFRIEQGGNFTLYLNKVEAQTPAGMAKAEGAQLKLVVVRNSVTGIDDLDMDTVASVKYVNLAGMVSDKPFDGVNLVVIKYNNGKTKTVKVVK